MFGRHRTGGLVDHLECQPYGVHGEGRIAVADGERAPDGLTSEDGFLGELQGHRRAYRTVGGVLEFVHEFVDLSLDQLCQIEIA